MFQLEIVNLLFICLHRHEFELMDKLLEKCNISVVKIYILAILRPRKKQFCIHNFCKSNSAYCKLRLFSEDFRLQTAAKRSVKNLHNIHPHVLKYNLIIILV